jgi:hypothetical protein
MQIYDLDPFISATRHVQRVFRVLVPTVLGASLTLIAVGIFMPALDGLSGAGLKLFGLVAGSSSIILGLAYLRSYFDEAFLVSLNASR